MEEFSIKVAGKRKTGKKPSLSELNEFFRLGIALKKAPHTVPKGVFRFRTFEEAQLWMENELIATQKKATQDRPL
ncbi:MAG: hypothetical protein RDV48_24190 [Candidatus Eremiobacteraeota bacterium]|nr:hypothetical protein [Candidatus Eremiobacteraeota bacterium]